LVPTGFGAAAAEALTRGDVAAIGYWGGYYIETEEMGFAYKCFTLPGMEAAPGHVLVTTEDFLADRPDIVERFGRAYAKGVYYASTHPEGAVRAYWAAYPDAKPVDVPEADALASSGRVIEKSVAEFFFDYDGWMLGHNSPEGWTAMVDYMVGSAQVEAAIPAEELINNDLIESMNAWDPAEIEALPDPE
jgi:NitT/TauT family transport system substrate-binding protein